MTQTSGLNIRVTVEFVCKNAISQEGLDEEFNGSISMCINQMVKDEGLEGFLFGCCEIYSIVKTEQDK